MENPIERVTIGKVTKRLIPFMFVLYVFCMLDRFNVTVAALTMKKELGFSDHAYGLGVGIFFIGYFLFEVPSNLIMEKVGPRRWIARIMFTWGIIASAMLFIKTPLQFYSLRFLLGLAEAGFFPGMVVYLTYWFPAVARARAAAKFMVATTVSGIIGGPLGAMIFKLDGVAGLHSWQWLFLLEGIPSFLLGFAVLLYMTDRPEHAHWLQAEEREWLIGRLAREQAHRLRHHNLTLWQALRHRKVLHIAALFFVMQASGAGLGAWANLLMQQRSNWSNDQILWFGTIPGIVGVFCMLAAAAWSDRIRERKKFLVAGFSMEVVGTTACAYVRSPVATLGTFTVNSIGGSGANAPFWAVTTSFLSGTAAAGAIAMINSIGNLGGFAGPLMMGVLKEQTNNYKLGLLISAGGFAVAAILAATLRHDKSIEHAEEIAESSPLEASAVVEERPGVPLEPAVDKA